MSEKLAGKGEEEEEDDFEGDYGDYDEEEYEGEYDEGEYDEGDYEEGEGEYDEEDYDEEGEYDEEEECGKGFEIEEKGEGLWAQEEEFTELPSTISPVTLISTYDAQIARVTSISDSLRKFSWGKKGERTEKLSNEFQDQLNSICQNSRAQVSKLGSLVEKGLEPQEEEPHEDREVCSSCSGAFSKEEIIHCSGCSSLFSKEGLLCPDCTQMEASCEDAFCGNCKSVFCEKKSCRKNMSVCEGCSGVAYCRKCQEDVGAICETCHNFFCGECKTTFNDASRLSHYFICVGCGAPELLDEDIEKTEEEE